MIRVSAVLGFCGLMAACVETTPFEQAPLGESVYKSAFQRTVFTAGNVDIVAASRRGMRTYTLRACGETVCGARRGTIQYTGDTAVVSGAYRGGTFHLTPGGGGYLQVGNDQTPIAWGAAD